MCVGGVEEGGVEEGGVEEGGVEEGGGGGNHHNIMLPKVL